MQILILNLSGYNIIYYDIYFYFPSGNSLYLEITYFASCKLSLLHITQLFSAILKVFHHIATFQRASIASCKFVNLHISAFLWFNVWEIELFFVKDGIYESRTTYLKWRKGAAIKYLVVPSCKHLSDLNYIIKEERYSTNSV